MLKRLLEHKPRLRHRTFGGIDEQKHAIRHRQHAFHFTAKVGVARGVNQVDLGDLFRDRIGVVDGDILGQNGDAAFTFERIRVEQGVLSDLAVAEVSALAQQRIDQRGLPMVNVGNDGYISNVVTHLIHL